MPFSSSKTLYTAVTVVTDPSYRKAGTADLVEFRIADNPGGDRYETKYVNASFRVDDKSHASFIKFIKKGDRISFNGREVQRKYKTKQGEERISLEVPWASDLVPHGKFETTEAAAPAPSEPVTAADLPF